MDKQKRGRKRLTQSSSLNELNSHSFHHQLSGICLINSLPLSSAQTDTHQQYSHVVEQRQEAHIHTRSKMKLFTICLATVATAAPTDTVDWSNVSGWSRVTNVIWRTILAFRRFAKWFERSDEPAYGFVCQGGLGLCRWLQAKRKNTFQYREVWTKTNSATQYDDKEHCIVYRWPCPIGIRVWVSSRINVELILIIFTKWPLHWAKPSEFT